jgi:regulator of replication initiation timing
VRGRKKNNFEHLEEEVEYLRRNNSQLLEANARLEYDNKRLRQDLDHARALLNPRLNSDPIDCYLSDDVLSHPSQAQRSPAPASTHMQEEDSLSFESINWLRRESIS